MESKEVKIIKRNLMAEEALGREILNRMEELTQKQNDFFTRKLWSEFIKELTELNENYERCIIRQCALDTTLYGIEHSEEE